MDSSLVSNLSACQEGIEGPTHGACSEHISRRKLTSERITFTFSIPADDKIRYNLYSIEVTDSQMYNSIALRIF